MPASSETAPLPLPSRDAPSRPSPSMAPGASIKLAVLPSRLSRHKGDFMTRSPALASKPEPAQTGAMEETEAAMDAAATNPDGNAKGAVAEPGAATLRRGGGPTGAFTEVREGMARFRASPFNASYAEFGIAGMRLKASRRPRTRPTARTTCADSSAGAPFAGSCSPNPGASTG